MTETKFLKPALFLTRLSIFYFLLPWQIMRFTSPESASGIAKKYYHVSGLSDSLGLVIGVFWMALLIAFLIGLKKSVSYGLVFILHAGAILIALPAYIMGTEGFNQLFLAAIPAAAAMGLLWMLRREDTLLSVGGKLG
ncbi:hypothetical protein [Litorimonas sp. WD9-15]|uniref:hypothetical protein n=1 Tax=Litorimonas sp. WD9-15 TaxID=3418716 RepID=UPI003CFC52FF